MNKLNKDEINKLITLYKNRKFLKLRSYCKNLSSHFLEDPVILVFWGLSYFETNQYEEAEKKFKEAISIDKENLEAHINLGNTYGKLKKFEKAIEFFNRSTKINPDNHQIYYNLAVVLQKTDNLKEAVKAYKKAIAINNKYSIAYNNLGNILQTQGKIKEAKKNFENAILYNPFFAEAYRHLGRITKYKKYNSRINDMEKIYQSKNIPHNDKIHLGFALGQAFEDIKNYEKSINYYIESNNLRRSQFDYSIDDDKNKIKKIKTFFNKKIINIKLDSKYQVTPIFIVGMLRSGTTLIEQIISSHSNVSGLGEIGKFFELVEENFFKKNKTFKKYSIKTEKNFYSLGNKYIEYIESMGIKNKYFTDKMPLNFMWIGFIKIAIPQAKIIHCVRNPLDNCLSIFKNYFVQENNKYSYNMDELGQFFNLYLDMMNFWKSIFPKSIYDVSYEKLILNQNNETRKLLSACGLNFESNCIKYYENKRNVKTASSYQVRRKLYNDSIDLWKNYEKNIQPLIKIVKKEH